MIRPAIWSLMQGKSRYRFNCRAYGGNLIGSLQFSENSMKPRFSTSVELTNINIDDFTIPSTVIGFDSTGTLDGTISYSEQTYLLADGTGEANLNILNGKITLFEQFFNLDSIDFDELLIKLSLRDQKIELSHVKLKGPKIQGTLSGSIRLKTDFLKSGLDLTGTIELLDALFEIEKGRLDTAKLPRQLMQLPFTIHGTIAEPKFNFT